MFQNKWLFWNIYKQMLQNIIYYINNFQHQTLLNKIPLTNLCHLHTFILLNDLCFMAHSLLWLIKNELIRCQSADECFPAVLHLLLTLFNWLRFICRCICWKQFSLLNILAENKTAEFWSKYVTETSCEKGNWLINV